MEQLFKILFEVLLEALTFTQGNTELFNLPGHTARDMSHTSLHCTNMSDWQN